MPIDLQTLAYLSIASIAGAVNLIVAWQRLHEKCKFLLLFRPLRTPGIWLWALVEFAVPVLLFWWLNSLALPPTSSTPPADFKLILEAFALGTGFSTILSAHEKVGALPFKIWSPYNLVLQAAYYQIARPQRKINAAFNQKLREALQAPEATLERGLTYLQEDYFPTDPAVYLQSDPKLIAAKKRDYEDRIAAARQATGDEQVRQIRLDLIPLIQRRDLPDVLRAFNCSERLIQQFFPATRRPPRRRLPN